MYFLIMLIMLAATCTSGELTFLIAAGLFAIADSVNAVKDKIRKDN